MFSTECQRVFLSKEPSHAQSNLKVGNPQASSSVNPSHTSLTKPPEVTQGSLLSPQGPWLLLSTFAFTAWKVRLQSLKSSPTGSENGPVQFPLQIQGMGDRRRRSQPWAPEEAQHHLEHPKVSHPLQTHSPAQLGDAQNPTAASPRAVSRPTSAVGSMEWPCCLQSRAGAGWCELEGWMLQRHALRMLPKGRDCTLCSLVGNLCSLTRAL